MEDGLVAVYGVVGEKDALAVTPVVYSIAAAVAECSAVLRVAAVQRASTTNSSGDDVLTIDLACDGIIQRHLEQCHSVGAFSSEETPELVIVGDRGVGGGSNSSNTFTVAFDPLDGSSIIDSNFAVGAIFGVWPGIGIVGRRVGDQEVAVAAVYGPRTTMFVGTRKHGVRQFVLSGDGKVWRVAPTSAAPSTMKEGSGSMRIAPIAKYFSPGNLRAVNTLKWYRKFIFTELVQQNCTLRYTGGMVPDVMQILVKGSGIFMTPASPDHKVKLRIAYECGPLAFLVSCAGGYATCAGHHSTPLCDPKSGICQPRPPQHKEPPSSYNLLDRVITTNDERGVVALGSAETVSLYEAYALAKNRRRPIRRTAELPATQQPNRRSKL